MTGKEKSLNLILAVVLLSLLGFIGAVCFGCTRESHGTFYSLEESYELQYLTKEDLYSIARYHNEGIAYPQELPAETERAIKETACERLREKYGIKNVSTDGISVKEYCGVYNHSYAVMIRDDYISTPTDVPNTTKEIDGVEFRYTGYGIIELWRAPEYA